MEHAGLYSDCGKEKTILKTSVIEKYGIKWLDVQVDFSPTPLRKEIPTWASVVYKMSPPRDIRHFQAITFRIFPIKETFDGNTDGDCGIERILIEIKPEGRDQIRHYSYPINMKKGPQTICIPLENLNPELLRQFEELCIVVNFNDLFRSDMEDSKLLHGHFRISQIKLL